MTHLFSTTALGLALLAGTAAGQATWLVDANGGGDFAEIDEAIASPLTVDGDTLFVEPGAYQGFVLDEALAIVAPHGEAFQASPIVVDGVSSFTLAGFATLDLTVRDVPGRGRLEDFEVGGLQISGSGEAAWLFGRAAFEDCGQLAVARGSFVGTDACYTFGPDETDPALLVVRSNVAITDCTFDGGDGDGWESLCDFHYPVAGEGVRIEDGSDVTLAGCAIRAGVGPFDVHPAAVWVEDSTVRVRGTRNQVLESASFAIDGANASATVSGVLLDPPALPAFVVRARALPWLRTVGSGAPASLESVQVFGPKNLFGYVAVGAVPGYAPAAGPLVAPLWLDPGAPLLLLPLVLSGPQAPTTLLVGLPDDPTLAGVGVTFQPWVFPSPAAPAGLGASQDLVLRW